MARGVCHPATTRTLPLSHHRHHRAPRSLTAALADQLAWGGPQRPAEEDACIVGARWEPEMATPFRHVLLGTLEVPGHEIELIVLDRAERRLMRVIAPRSGDLTNFGYVVLEQERAPEEADPARPDLRVAAEVSPTEQIAKRRHLVSWLEHLSASERLAPLGFPGPSVPYARFDGTRPSLAILALREPTLGRGRNDEAVLEFAWGPLRQMMPVTKELEARLGGGPTVTHRKGWHHALGRVPRFALAAYAPPDQGYCRKLVVTLV